MNAPIPDMAPAIAATAREGPISQAEWEAHRRAATQSLPAALLGASLPDVLLSYQQELLATTAANAVTIVDKSRRIGATWGVGADAVLTAGAKKSAGGMDVLYIGYNLDMAREFIDVCAMWAKAFAPACTAVQEFLFREEGEGGERSIAAYRIAFASGFEIVALSSRPRSLRGRQGYVILDEFAFHDDPAGLLKAAMALLIWGGRVLIISTHNGETNLFNQLIQESREGRKPYAVVRCTFDDALDQGLYQRICLVTGKEWSPEAEAKWRAEVRAFYGDDAAEELDCIPAQGSGVYLTRATIEACMNPAHRVLRLTCPQAFELRSDAERGSFVADWLEREVDPWLERLDPALTHFFGYDFARSGDLSILLPLQERQDLVCVAPFILELRNVPFREQEQILFHVVDRLPRFVAGKLDATGSGAFLAEVAAQRYGGDRIEQVNLSQAWYLENMPPLKAAFEDRTFELPRDADTLDDMRAIKLVRGVPMVPRDERKQGADGRKRHGDTAIAAVLAHAASRADVIEYGYQALPAAAAGRRLRARPLHDDDLRPAGGRRGLGGRGTW